MGYPPLECINGGSQKSRWKSYIGGFCASLYTAEVFCVSNTNAYTVLALRDVCARFGIDWLSLSAVLISSVGISGCFVKLCCMAVKNWVLVNFV